LRSLPVSLGERLVRHRISPGLAQKDATLELGVVRVERLLATDFAAATRTA
jgi:hypothetical protein